MSEVSIAITAEVADKIVRPVVGEGGFQDLLRKIQSRFDRETLSLYLDQEDLERVLRYVQYGTGGYEERLEPLVQLLRDQRIVPSD